MESLVEKKDLLTAAKFVGLFLLAFAIPLLLLTNQFNERHPFIVYLVTVPAVTLAGYIVGRHIADGKPNLKFTAWSAFVGAVIASLIAFVA